MPNENHGWEPNEKTWENSSKHKQSISYYLYKQNKFQQVSRIIKTKHSNETFHLGLYSLSNVFSCRKHISSKSNISVLTISGKSRNIKIIAPSPLHFIINHPIWWYSLNIPEGSFYYDPPILRYFSGTPISPAYSTSLQLSTEVLEIMLWLTLRCETASLSITQSWP